MSLPILATALLASLVAAAPAPAPLHVNINAPLEGVPAAHFYNGTSAAVKRQNGQACVQVQSTISTWYYTFTGVWGSETGQGPESIGSFCVAENDGAGGALYIGPEPNPGPGSTKFECKFPTSGQSNCDVSLVDGYSLSFTCTTPDESATIGGGVDLYTQGNACPDQQGPNCINQDSYNGQGQGGVNTFFQPAVNNGNNYCIFNDCSQDYYFDIADGLTCTVSGTDA